MTPVQRRIALAVSCLALAILIVALVWSRRSGTDGAKYTARAPAPAPSVAPTGETVPKPASATPSDMPAADTGMRAALEHARKLKDPRARSMEFTQLLQQWIATDLDAALAYVRQMPRGSEFTQGLFMVLDALSRRDLDRALAVAAETITAREDRAFYSNLFDRLARENVNNAIQRLAAVPAGESREFAIRALADVWSRTAPDAALAWAQQLADAADRTVALETTLNELAARDPMRAIELAQGSLKSPVLERVVSRGIQRLSATDPAAASGLVPTLPPGDVQTMAALEVARALAVQDIQAALDWARTLKVEVTQWLAINNILSIWAQKDLAAVGRYVHAMPPGPGLDFIARHAAALLAHPNPREAVMWAEALPTDSSRSAALIMVASTWAQRSPAEAVNWAATLREEPLRTDAITGAHSYWMLLDPPAARAWLETADLTPETKSKLLRSREVQF